MCACGTAVNGWGVLLAGRETSGTPDFKRNFCFLLTLILHSHHCAAVGCTVLTVPVRACIKRVR